MGLGLHGGGLATVRWLLEQGAHVLVTDIRDESTLAPTMQKLKTKKNITWILGKHRLQDFRNADCIIKNPGVPRRSKYLTAARKSGVPIETDVSIFLRRSSGTIIGITGTKGKSTTATLVYQLLHAAGKPAILAGNIRIPPLTVLKKVTTETLVVMELSSWQIEDSAHVKSSPSVAVITNVLPDHLNRYGSMKTYAAAKALIVRHQTKSDIAVLNYDNAYTRAIGGQVPGQRLWFTQRNLSEQNAVYMRGNRIYYRHQGISQFVCFAKDIRLPGKHNIANALAAIAVAKQHGVTSSVIKRVLRSFKGVPYRFELVRKWKGTAWYNDTTATAPDAAIAALNNFQKKVILIAGGADKKMPYHELAKHIKQKVKYLILLEGTATEKILIQLRKVGFTAYEIVESMEHAVRQAQARTKKGDAVLLSPAAASFGMFVNEFDRGDQYKKQVKQLS